MKPQVKKCLAALSVVAFIAAHPAAATAQTASSGSSLSGGVSLQETNEIQPTLDTAGEPVAIVEGPFEEWGIPTPPGAEGYEVNQVTGAELYPQGLDEWHPTDDPQSEIIPGQMRSDKEEISAGTSKADADHAEIKEARLADSGTTAFFARPGCGVYWPAPFEVCGAIKNLYDSLGGPTSFLLLPKSNELTNPDGVGKRSEFANGFIYWHPRTGAHTVSIPASRVWQRHGWENGFLGYPTTSDITLGNQWYVQHFEGGHVYTHNALPATQASIQGAIYDKWQSMGGHNSDLGFPISDERTTPDGIGRYNVFEGGMIYWTPQHGAHEVQGLSLLMWAKSGFEKGEYGYPVSDSHPNEKGETVQDFQRGSINVTQKIRTAGVTQINGKDYSNLLLTYLGESIAVNAPLAAQGATPYTATTTSKYDNGGVSIPSRYIYDPSQGNLHDYCSYSPDFFDPTASPNYPYIERAVIADLRGACARHDLCYERYDADSGMRYACNRQFEKDLLTMCSNVYADAPRNLPSCRRNARMYYDVVVVAHPSHWEGHISNP